MYVGRKTVIKRENKDCNFKCFKENEVRKEELDVLLHANELVRFLFKP